MPGKKQPSGLYWIDLRILGRPAENADQVLKQGTYLLEGEESDAKEEAVERFLQELRPLLSVSWKGPLKPEKAVSRKKVPSPGTS